MNPRLRLGAAATLALALITGSLVGATSAQATQVSDPPAPDERRDALTTASSVLLAEPAAIKAAAGDEFTLSSAVTGVRGLQFLTYARTHRGLPVYGGDVVVGTDESGAVVTTVTTGQRAVIDVDVKARVSAAAAAVTARKRAGTAVASVATPKLVVHATTETPRPAWEVVVSAAERPSILHVYVDARTGKVIDQWDEVRDGTGTGDHVGTVSIDTTPAYSMRDPNRPGVQCGGQNGQPYTKSVDTWGNGSGTDLETACVDALYAAQREWDMLRDWLGRDGVNGQGGGYPARVGLPAVNAYWYGSYATFGRNQSGSAQLTSIDVVAHEFGHGVFQFSGGGGAGGGNETGGLNESTGDIFGALTEAYADNPNDTPDYVVGEEVDLAGSGPIRNMYNPQALGHPNCYSASIPNTEVHAAAGPQNHWFYLVAEGTNPAGKPASARCDGGGAIAGLGVRKAGEIFMTALNTKTQPWTHAKARVATLNAARTLYSGCAEYNVVRAAWDGVNVRPQPGEQPCDEGDEFSMALDPASGGTQPGGTATTTVRTTVTGGSAQPITLRASGLPSGVTASFSPATIQAGQSSTLTLATSAASPQGAHAITVTADGSDVDRTATYTLRIGEVADDFSVTVSPSSASVQPGGSATATLATQVTSGDAQSVALSASGAPAGVTVTFNPGTITAGQSSSVTIATTSGVAPGTYQISLNADGTGVDRSTAFSLTVGGDQGGTWAPWTPYAVGDVVTYQGAGYRCIQAHTSLPGWEPAIVPALWQRI
ncbi:Leupeptin-inactivating enzyme 2 [Nonomuraea phyllanthi]|uniref:Leupeptin-inactivating enzyme 2 n=1 Tax=Nonomuraea phyllanthi TaxID=2219224 RepID=A0A5C4WX25_9ACTN|nr:M4 family metallopeptidase [Nonomuraea phyllanthi]KAB8197178.1 Leupeptin-inactivating enzyme 2 [Nonomuraea phyllanthi]